ncbi:DUF2894 domain-containing protein, partial [Bordetella bronchiseptica]
GYEPCGEPCGGGGPPPGGVVGWGAGPGGPRRVLASPPFRGPPAGPDPARAPGPLGQLCAQIAAAAPARPADPEQPRLDEFRQARTPQSTHPQQRQSEQLVPENAGPLNSSHLAHRSLALMQGLSPGYLQQFLSYVDALGWLEQLTANAAPAARDTARATPRKTARARSR